MKQEIKTWRIRQSTNQVKEFFKHLLGMGIVFHPDTPFEDYVQDGKRVFTDTECKRLDDLMFDCFWICKRKGVDIYQIAIDVYNESELLNGEL